MADSTSRWAEALREVSGRLGELPGEDGYPAYLSSRLGRILRARRARRRRSAAARLGHHDRRDLPARGRLLRAGDQPHQALRARPSGASTAKRAQARFYPAIHPLQSYAEDAGDFAPWWAEHGNGSGSPSAERLLTLLDEQAQLERMARIVGKDALPARQQLTLLCAELVNEAFLRQSAFSEVDRFCSPARQSAMMRLLGRFIDLAEAALAPASSRAHRPRSPACARLQRMGEEIGDDQLRAWPSSRRASSANSRSSPRPWKAHDAAHG